MFHFVAEVPMTAPEFRAALKTLGLTVAGFAALTGQHHTTLYRWGYERDGRVQPIPKWVPLLLGAWTEYELLADALSEPRRAAEPRGRRAKGESIKIPE